jgi:hypothetical protein
MAQTPFVAVPWSHAAGSHRGLGLLTDEDVAAF